MFAFLRPVFSAQSSADINGFATLAVTHESEDDIVFRPSYYQRLRDKTSLLTDSVVGIQANWQINDDFDIFIQGILRDQFEHTIDDVTQLAFIRYRTNRNFSLLAGRINTNLYMLSDYRYASHAQLWARPPLAVYSQAETAESVDGFGVNFARDMFDGYANLRAVFGHNDTRDANSIVRIDDMLSISAKWTNFDLSLFASFTKGNVSVVENTELDLLADSFSAVPRAIWPEANTISKFLGTPSVSSSYQSIGIKYEKDIFVLQSELSRYRIDWLLASDTISGYFSAGYKFANVTPYLLFGFVEAQDNEVNVDLPPLSEFVDQVTLNALQPLADAATNVAEAGRFSYFSVSAGMRWDVTGNTAVKLQFDHYFLNLISSGTAISVKEQQNIVRNKDLSVLHLSVSWIF